MKLAEINRFVKQHKATKDPALQRMVARYTKRGRYLERYLRRGSRQKGQR